MRKACVEPITFNSDGSINEAEMTSQGAGEPLMANIEIDAARACLLYGNVRINAFTKYNEVLTGIKNGDVAAYKYLNFSTDADSFKVNAAPGKKGVSINIALDNSWGNSIGQVNIPGNGDGSKVQSFACKIKRVNGIHSVWLRFYGDSDELIKLDSFSFE